MKMTPSQVRGLIAKEAHECLDKAVDTDIETVREYWTGRHDACENFLYWLDQLSWYEEKP